MGKPNRRRVRMQEFKAQVAEAVLPPDGLVEVEVSDGASVWIKIPLNLPDEDDFAERLREAKSGKEMALIVLGGHPEVSAQEQWETWTAAGHDESDLASVFGAESQAAQERMRGFRYQG